MFQIFKLRRREVNPGAPQLRLTLGQDKMQLQPWALARQAPQGEMPQRKLRCGALVGREGWGPPHPDRTSCCQIKSTATNKSERKNKTTLQERGTGAHREKEMACSASGVVAKFSFVEVFFNLSFLLCHASASLWRGLCSHHPLGFGAGRTEGLPALLSSRCSPGMTWSCRPHSLEQAHSPAQLSSSYPSERQGSLK